jgi:SAM-dependent methyltransferase
MQINEVILHSRKKHPGRYGWIASQDNHDVYHTATYTLPGRMSAVFGNNLPQINGGYILDAGCSYGVTTDEISEKYPESTVIGIDINHNEIRRARLSQRKGVFLVEDGFNNQFPNGAFKAVFSMNNFYQRVRTLTNEQIDKCMRSLGRLVGTDDGYLLLGGQEIGCMSLSREAYGHLILRRARKKFDIVSEQHDIEKRSVGTIAKIKDSIHRQPGLA